MGFGFVVVKFALFLKQIAFVFGEQIYVGNRGVSTWIGIAMVVLGALVAVASSWNYFRVKRQLEREVYLPSKLLPLFLAFFVVMGSILLILYLLPNIQHSYIKGDRRPCTSFADGNDMIS